MKHESFFEFCVICNLSVPVIFVVLLRHPPDVCIIRLIIQEMQVKITLSHSVLYPLIYNVAYISFFVLLLVAILTWRNHVLQSVSSGPIQSTI
jgi:hypothetical protein